MITIVAGTNRPQAKTLEIAHYYKNLLDQQPSPVESRILDLAQLPADFTVSALYANSGKNTAFNALRAQMDESDKYVFVVPEYNNSFPGVLKAFIDGLSYPNSLVHKKCALVGISDGVQGNALGLSHLSDVFNYLGLNVLAQKVRIPLMKKNFVNGSVNDPFIANLLQEQAQLLLAF
jgi:NAD(P)H-dependent FMN reductase